MKKKTFLLVFAIGLIAAGAVYYYVFIYSATHRRSAADKECIVVSAVDLVKAYQANEAASDNKYLGQPLQITGVVSEVKKDSTGTVMLTLKSDDAFAGVSCTLNKTGNSLPTIGATVTVKGFCNGFLSDVSIGDAVIDNK